MCRIWRVLWRALVKYSETDGEQRAASFAYYAFFSLFPLILLFISIGAAFLGDTQRVAAQVVQYVGQYIPLEAGKADMVFSTIDGLVRSRSNASVIASIVLAWSALRFFQALVHGVNKAWGTKEYSWWRMPLQNLLVLCIVGGALLLGIVVPISVDTVERYYQWGLTTMGLEMSFAKKLFDFIRFITPPLILFSGFSIFYRVAPRRRTRFREVWIAALVVTLGLQGVQRLFVLYTTNITDFNRVYGALGSVLALLLWIYLSGSIIIFGGCLCAAYWEIEMHIADQSERTTAR